MLQSKKRHKMKSILRSIPCYPAKEAFAKVADEEISNVPTDSQGSTEGGPFEDLELEYSLCSNKLLNVDELPAQHTPSFFALYKLKSFRTKYKEAVEHIVGNIQEIAEGMTESLDSIFRTLTEINSFIWLATENLVYLDAMLKNEQIEERDTEFMKYSTNQIKLLELQSKYLRKHIKALKLRLSTNNDAIQYCCRTYRQDYSKQVNKVKSLLNAHESNSRKKEAAHYSSEDLHGRLKLECRDIGYAILYKEGGTNSTSKWVYCTNIPKVTLKEMINLTFREFQTRYNTIRVKLLKFGTQIEEENYELDNTDLPFRQWINKLVRLIEFRNMPLEEEEKIQLLLTVLKLKRASKNLTKLFKQASIESAHIFKTLGKLRKKLKRKKVQKSISSHFPRHVHENSQGVRIAPMDLLTQWPEILVDFVFTETILQTTSPTQDEIPQTQGSKKHRISANVDN